MFVEYIFIILGCCVLSSDCHHLNKTICEGSSCYFLYENKTSFLTWGQSHRACNTEGLEMLGIESRHIQTVIEGLVNNLPENTARQIWIGGRRSTDDTWRYINGTEFNKHYTTNNESAQYCLYVHWCKNDNPEYRADNCDEKNSNSRLLCQFDQSKTDRCNSSDSHFGDKCYRKTTHDGQEANRIDWYNGETYCSQSDIQGDIAYSYLDDDTLKNSILNLVAADSNDCLQFWFGVRKRIWFWITGSNNDGDKRPINYFNWHNNTKIDSSDDDCIYIDRDKGNKWFTTNCTTSYLRYYICMNGSSQTSIKTTTTTTVPSVSIIDTVTATTKTTAREIENVNTTTTDSSDNNNKNGILLYTVPIIVVIVLTIVIGLAVFFVMKKRQNSNDEQRYVNEEFHRPSAEQAKNDDPEYADVEPPNDQDDVIDPYGITGIKKTRNDDVRHKEAPSGDLYAVSSKQTIKTDDDINKNKKGINPEELYAKPNKKINKKPNMDNVGEENEATKSGNAVGMETPSGVEKSSGSKHTEHFETETGDVYAKVTKEGLDSEGELLTSSD